MDDAAEAAAEEADSEPLSDSNGSRRYAVVADSPVEVINPRGSFLRLNLVWALALLIVASVAAYGATEVSNHRSEARIAGLLAELDRRTAERKANEAKNTRAAAVTYRILEQNRRTHCSEMRAVRQLVEQLPEVVGSDAIDEINKLYPAYHCGTADEPVVEPGWTPPPGWPPLPGAEPLAPPSPSPIPAPTQ